ncbi:MAG: hypothetical protein VX210_19140 [Myxococcota bacterium]|nr:hypothetical protein [Myxococcota bacterium]
MKTLLYNSLIWLALMLVIGCGSSESNDTDPADVADPTTTQETDDPTTDDTTTDDETDDSTTVEDLALAGKYVDSWGTEHEISNDVWLQGSSAYHISAYDNETGTIIAQNDASNAYNPDLWSRFDWAYVADKLWYCQTAYAAESEEAALATEAADATNPAEEGCGGFSWTQLNEALEIRGEYGDSWGGEHTITQTAWVSGSSSYAISQFDNEAKFIIAQNGEENAYNPGLWSRFDWAKVDGNLWYCQTAYAAESEEAALATEAADATNPAEEGCCGFGWTQLVDALEIRGEFCDSWGGEHTISQTALLSGCSS